MANFWLPDPQTIPHRPVAACLQFLLNTRPQRLRARDLVQISGMSRRGLHKAFRRHLGYGPGTALRRVRIQLAVQLLTATAIPVEQVARTCGYRSGNSLCVAFQRNFKTTPLSLRGGRRGKPTRGGAGLK